MTKKNLFQSGLALLVCLFLFAGSSYAQTKTVRVEYGGATTWEVPVELDGTPITVTKVTFEAWGGGGAGGFCDGGHLLTAMVVSGAGGGGAYGRTVIDDPTANETFTLSVGAGGYNTAEDNSTILKPWSNYKNRTEAHGQPSTVTRNSIGGVILEAKGGNTVTGINNLTGANGGAATGAGTFHSAGGKGGNGAYDCPESIWPYAQLAGRRSSGGGGGAAGPSGNGNNGGDAYCDANDGWGAGGTSNGAGGAGGRGTSDHNDVLGGQPVGKPGNTFGGGGGGTKAAASWHSGGRGANGGIIITYTYTTTAVPSITVDNATTTICSGTNYDVILDVDLLNVDPSTVQLVPGAVSVTGLNFASPTLSYESGEYHLKGTATNTTSGTLTANMECYLKSGSTNSNTFTFTLNVYGKLDGGIIAEDQIVCQGQTIQTLTSVTDATGGSGTGNYQWWQWVEIDENGNWGSSDWEQISGANGSIYTPMLTGLRYFARQYKDNVCGNVYATDGAGSQYLNVTTVDPYTFKGGWSSNDTICSTVSSYSKTLGWEMATPAYLTSYGQYWQKSTDKGTTWTNLAPGFVSGYSPYSLTLTSSDLTAGSDLWYRAAVKINDCDSIPSNEIYKLHIKDIPPYNGQFPDVNITLWYGACDTNIANLPAPTLDPTPKSITRTDSYTIVDTGTYTITWAVTDDCDIVTNYDQKVTVKFPACGTLTEPLTVTDDQGNEYQTIRIGCDCWFAENLRTNAGNAAYYNEDEANKDFGKLYTWQDAVGSNNTEMPTKLGTTYIQGVCPEGWSIPTVAQFNTMFANAGGTVEDIMSDDQDTWLPGYAGTNTSGFAAKGAGYYEGMTYQRQLGYTYFWTSDLNTSDNTVAKVMELRCGCGEFTCTDKNKEDKLSVRCVKVEPVEFVCGLTKMKDADDNEYETVEIGTQCWTKTNLRVAPAGATDETASGNTSDTDPYYYVNSSVDATVYGYYYNWEAAKLACPSGWHLPSEAEWNTFTSYVGSQSAYVLGGGVENIAKALASETGWNSYSGQYTPGDQGTYTNNATGFSAVPAGLYDGDNSLFKRKGEQAIFASSDPDTYCDPSLTNNQQNIRVNYNHPEYGFAGCFPFRWGLSVRCLKD